MPESSHDTEVITLRVPREIARRLTSEARRQRRTRSAVARAILAEGLGRPSEDPLVEARRQSLLVRRRPSERRTLQFISRIADIEGWE